MALQQESQLVETSFLLAGPQVRCEVPVGFTALPELISPVGLGEDRARDCLFKPTAMDIVLPGSPDYTHIDTLDGAAGRKVEVYERADGHIWFLRWPLGMGALYIHIRTKVDGYESVPVVAQSLVVEEDVGSTPVVVLEPPLYPAVRAEPSFRERISFAELTPEGGLLRGLMLTRPGVLQFGRRSDPTTSRELAGHRRGGPFGIDLQLNSADSPEEADAVLSRLSASIEKG